MSEIKLLQGNEACVEGALAAGVTFFAGYPITPSSEIAEGFAERLPKSGGVFVQMEDEIASMAAVIGGAMAGRKALTATSGPGFSLKQECIGFAAMIEAPCVIVNVQRTGPSTGLPTSPAQGDMMQARWGSHGDRPALALYPTSVSETFDLTVKAVNWAERFRTPVVLLLDEVVGHMREGLVLPEIKKEDLFERKRPHVAPGNYKPYEVLDEDLVPPLPDYGTGYRFHTTGLFHDETGFPTNKPGQTAELINRLMGKIEKYRQILYIYEEMETNDAEHLFISFGATARSARAACRMARQKGIKAGLLILKTIWPFPREIVAELGSRMKNVIVAEMNMGQMIGEVERAVAGKANVCGSFRADGELNTPEEILNRLEGVC